MILDYLRLALATGLVLLPGHLVARALGQRSVSATIAWTMAALFAAWALVFAVHGSVWLAIAVLAAVGAGAAFPARRAGFSRLPREEVILLAAGVLLGLALWHVAGAVTGDALFHLGRVRKLTELGDLHLTTVDEFRDGGLHPGYAFPLWHGFLAVVAKLSGLDPATVVNHEGSLLAPLACAAAWEAGVAVFGRVAAGWSVLAAQLGLYCFAPGHGGSWATLELPGTVSRQLLVPAAIALLFEYKEERRWAHVAGLASIFGALALVHPTYALFLLIPLCAYSVLRVGQWRRSAVAIASALVPTAAAFLWLTPIVRETVSHNPGSRETARALTHYADQLVVHGPDHYRLKAEVIGRGGAVAVAALLLVPLAGLSIRRRWAAFVLGGFVSILALMLIPQLFTRFSDLVSLSQSRRAAGFVPFTFAFAGGLALVMRYYLLVPLGLVAGIVFHRLWPGDFAYGLREGGPAFAAWWAFAGGAAAIALGFALWRAPPRERHGLGAAAAVLFVVPLAVHAAATWSPRVPHDVYALSPNLMRALERVPPRSVVIAPLEQSYRIAAYAPVYVVAAPPAHVADTTKNRPYERRRAVIRWLRTKDPAIPRRYGATWALDENGRFYRLHTIGAG
jgi:hypothetical protein